MPAFLIITTFNLAFYLGLLVFLYRDGHKRRYGAPSVYNVQARSVAELGLPPAFDTVRSPGGKMLLRSWLGSRQPGSRQVENASHTGQFSQGYHSSETRSRQRRRTVRLDPPRKEIAYA